MRSTTMPVVAGLAIAAALAPAMAQDPFAGLDLVWVRPASEPACARLLVLNTPRDWIPGDAAVAVFVPEGAEAAVRPLVAALLPELAAVLEVPSRPVEGCRAPPPSPVAEVLGAVRALRMDASAGLVVAIGLGAAGQAVLDATSEAVAARHLGAGGPRLAAAIALDGAGPAAFATGALPDDQQWAERAALLCTALASASSQVGAGACLAGLAVDRPLARAARRPRR
ncbi:MAG TPA: hypothetical protein VN329_02165 [Roseomonas sp.]|nr:hypothetical protein [Roseomonas sp.]